MMERAYAPYSDFPVGAAGLVDDGRVVLGCNVENASYGLGLCAECGLVSALHGTGGGRLVAMVCVDRHGETLMPCGRCRQLLWENGGPEMQLATPSGVKTMADVLPDAFGPDDLENALTVDLADPGFVADPYPTLAELRKAGPMLWHEPSDRWLATTHDAVTRVLRDRAFGRLWTDWEPADEMAPFNALHRNQMMENEPPEHTRLRRLVAGAFGRGHVERMRPRIEAPRRAACSTTSIDPARSTC